MCSLHTDFPAASLVTPTSPNLTTHAHLTRTPHTRTHPVERVLGFYDVGHGDVDEDVELHDDEVRHDQIPERAGQSLLLQPRATCSENENQDGGVTTWGRTSDNPAAPCSSGTNLHRYRRGQVRHSSCRRSTACSQSNKQDGCLPWFGHACLPGLDPCCPCSPSLLPLRKRSHLPPPQSELLSSGPYSHASCRVNGKGKSDAPPHRRGI